VGGRGSKYASYMCSKTTQWNPPNTEKGGEEWMGIKWRDWTFFKVYYIPVYNYYNEISSYY
jgi:hypothetical protein